MAKLNVPSAQHMARNWSPDPRVVEKKLVDVALNPPWMTYNPIHGYIRDVTQFGVPLHQVLYAIEQKVKKESTKRSFKEIITLVSSYFDEVRPDFVNSVSRRYYPIGPGILVPWDMQLLYGVGGKLVVPWFSFWASNPVKGLKGDLFANVVFDLLEDDPDLEDAEFQFIDLARDKDGVRGRPVTYGREYNRLSAETKAKMFAPFVEGYNNAKAFVEGEATNREKGREKPYVDPRQGSFF